MWNQNFKPIATDDADLRFFECQVTKQNPGAQQSLMTLTELGHLAGLLRYRPHRGRAVAG